MNSEKKPDLGSQVDYQKVEQYPSWVIQPSYENSIAGVGSAKISQLGFDFARKEAMASARADLAAQIEVKVEHLMKSYSSKAGIGDTASVDTMTEKVSKELVNLNLKGATLRNTWISPDNTLYVLMSIDNERLKESASAAIKNPNNYANQNEDVKIKAKAAQGDLEKELDTYFGPASQEPVENKN